MGVNTTFRVPDKAARVSGPWFLPTSSLSFTRCPSFARGKGFLRKPQVVYYEWRKREVKIRLMNESRYDERLKVRVEESTYVTRPLSLSLSLKFVYYQNSRSIKTPRTSSCELLHLVNCSSRNWLKISSRNWLATLPQRGALRTFSAAG